MAEKFKSRLFSKMPAASGPKLKVLVLGFYVSVSLKRRLTSLWWARGPSPNLRNQDAKVMFKYFATTQAPLTFHENKAKKGSIPAEEKVEF